MCGTADSLMVTQYVRYSRQFNADTVCNDANDSVHNGSAISQLISAIYSFCVLTEQHSDRRNSIYKQQTETHRQQVMTNHTFKEQHKKYYNCEREICVTIFFLIAYRVLLHSIEFTIEKDNWWVNSRINNTKIQRYWEIS